MNSTPPTERLEKRLARVAREQGVDQERLRRWVSFLAVSKLPFSIGPGPGKPLKLISDLQERVRWISWIPTFRASPNWEFP